MVQRLNSIKEFLESGTITKDTFKQYAFKKEPIAIFGDMGVEDKIGDSFGGGGTQQKEVSKTKPQNNEKKAENNTQPKEVHETKAENNEKRVKYNAPQKPAEYDDTYDVIQKCANQYYKEHNIDSSNPRYYCSIDGEMRYYIDQYIKEHNLDPNNKDDVKTAKKYVLNNFQKLHESGKAKRQEVLGSKTYNGMTLDQAKLIIRNMREKYKGTLATMKTYETGFAARVVMSNTLLLEYLQKENPNEARLLKNALEASEELSKDNELLLAYILEYPKESREEETQRNTEEKLSKHDAEIKGKRGQKSFYYRYDS